MTSPTRNLTQKFPFLPPGVGQFARRRFGEIAGLGSGLIAIGLLAALATYDPSDPSINTAVRAIPQNLMGMPGAWTADLMIQSMGLASWLVVPVFAAWAWRLLAHRGLGRAWLRITAVPVALLLATIGLSALPKLTGWPLGAGLGGVTGDILLADLSVLFAGMNITAGVIGGIAAAGSAVAAVTAMGLSVSEWRGLGGGFTGSARSLVFRGRQSIHMGRKAVGVSGEILKRGKAMLSRGRLRIEPLFDEVGEPDDEIDIARPSEQPSRTQRVASSNHADNPIVAPRTKRPTTGKREAADRQARLVLEPGKERNLPPLDILNPTPRAVSDGVPDKESLEQNARLLETVLDDFGVRGQIVKVRPGPVVTLYELEPAPGTKSSRVIGLADDIARSMSAVSVRVAVIPGRNVIGIELPNVLREIVALRELLSSAAYERTAGQLTLALGKDIGGAPVLVDLARMPHLLIAGTTGSGKSVAINTMILSLLYRLTPEQCRMIMIDPKML
ncbi:MAG: DNA translocase FtsK, partial [Rhodospirillales bacterium]|nr:DNA translocase FtsK [Rhodospirillales bacterium]